MRVGEQCAKAPVRFGCYGESRCSIGQRLHDYQRLGETIVSQMMNDE